MPRFFVLPEHIKGKQFTLLGSEAHHATIVLRKKPGDVIDLFDGKDLSYQGRITFVSNERIEGEIVAEKQRPSTASVDLILFQALLKGPKWDWLVEKACEIGVTTLVPITTTRTIVKPSVTTANERWKRIAMSASKQCGRTDVMKVSDVLSFDAAVAEKPMDRLSIIPWEKESSHSIQNACVGFKGKQVAVFVGPEGGWDPLEMERAERQKVIPVRLGPTLLRSETAGLVSCTLVLREWGVY